jgi:hypothetical protein
MLVPHRRRKDPTTSVIGFVLVARPPLAASVAGRGIG